MIGYTPAEHERRDAAGQPSATGMDDEATWHDHPDTPEARPAA